MHVFRLCQPTPLDAALQPLEHTASSSCIPIWRDLPIDLVDLVLRLLLIAEMLVCGGLLIWLVWLILRLIWLVCLIIIWPSVGRLIWLVWLITRLLATPRLRTVRTVGLITWLAIGLHVSLALLIVGLLILE